MPIRLVVWAVISFLLFVGKNAVGQLLVENRPTGIQWSLPLVIEAGNTALESGSLISVGKGVANFKALAERGIPSQTLVVLFWDQGRSKWVKIPQARIDALPYGAFMSPGTLYFKLQRKIEPLATDRNYLLVSAGKSEKNDWVESAEKLPMDRVFQMADTPREARKGWILEGLTKAKADILAEPSSGTVEVVYDGNEPTSSVTVYSKPMPVPAGRLISAEAVYRIEEIPECTMASLPDEKLIQYPGHAEAFLSAIVWGVVFKNAHGEPVVGPSFWSMERLKMEAPLTLGATFYVPVGAATMQVRWNFQGKGKIRLKVHDLIVRTLPSSPAGEYNIYEDGKVTFPQIEISQFGSAVHVKPNPSLWFSSAFDALSSEEKNILSDGIAFLKPVLLAGKAPAQAAIRVGLLADSLELPVDVRGNPALFQRVKNLPADGYLLHITQDHILVLGRDRRGAFYGLQELGERIRLSGENSGVKPALIIDWPELPLRMVHQLAYWIDVKNPKEYYSRWIPELARLRINAFAFDIREGWYRLDQKEVRDYWTWLFTFCRQWQVTPVPMGYNFRNPMPVAEGLQWLASKWMENEPYTLVAEKPVPIKNKPDGYYARGSDLNATGFSPNLLGRYPIIPMLEASNPVIATSADGKTTYTLGRDFVIEGKYEWNPGLKTRIPSAALKLTQPYTVRRTKTSRIPSGSKILLSYNYLYRQRGWANEDFSTCISEPQAEQLTGKALADTIRLLKPEIIHLNQDEINGIGRDGRDRLLMKNEHLTPGQLFANHLNRLRDGIRQAGSDAPLLVWDDGLNPLHGGLMLNYNGPYYTFDAPDYLSAKDFIINVWWYGEGGNAIGDWFLKRRFPIVGSSTESRDQIIAWCYFLSDRKIDYPDLIKGMFMTAWRDPNVTVFLARRDLARYAWNCGPWIKTNGKSVMVYDLNYRPVSVKTGNHRLSPVPAKPSPDDWMAWQAGYIYRCDSQDSGIEGTAELEITNEGGYRSRKNVFDPLLSKIAFEN